MMLPLACAARRGQTSSSGALPRCHLSRPGIISIVQFGVQFERSMLRPWVAWRYEVSVAAGRGQRFAIPGGKPHPPFWRPDWLNSP